ncbi:calcium binding EGF domain-containing protein [Aphelenchoides avenae]|nr:calcium binding EGF domain-containing protein [Aphelenchus avenae]
MFTTTIVVLVAAELRFKNDRVGHVPTDLAAKNNWTDDFPECEPYPAPACLTKTCVTGASAWSGLRECTCDDEKPASPKLTPLDLMRKAWMQSASVVSTIKTTSESAQLILLVWPELWQVDPSNDRAAVVNGSEVFQDPLDFALWYDQEAILVQAQKGGSRICQLAPSNDSSALSVECGDNDNRHLDDTDVPLWLQFTLDWIHGTYYWSGDDENYGAIGVYDIATKRRRVLFHGLKNQIEPSDVVVDPLAGYIFWIDNARRAIVRADTDGRNMTEVVMLPLIQALALDVGDQRIFWIKSSSLHIIASSDYSGNDVRTVFRSCLFVKGMSASLAVLDQRVFWTNDDTLLSVAKNGSESVPRTNPNQLEGFAS